MREENEKEKERGKERGKKKSHFLLKLMLLPLCHKHTIKFVRSFCCAVCHNQHLSLDYESKASHFILHSRPIICMLRFLFSRFYFFSAVKLESHIQIFIITWNIFFFSSRYVYLVLFFFSPFFISFSFFLGKAS